MINIVDHNIVCIILLNRLDQAGPRLAKGKAKPGVGSLSSQPADAGELTYLGCSLFYVPLAAFQAKANTKANRPPTADSVCLAKPHSEFDLVQKSFV